MRSISRLALLVLAVFLPLGCNHQDDVISPALPPAAPAYTALQSAAGSWEIVLTGRGVGPNRVALYVKQGVTSHPGGIDLLLRIDAAAGASVVGAAANLCSTRRLRAEPTANPGEWRLWTGVASSCGCPPPEGPVATIELYVDRSGSWPISLDRGKMWSCSWDEWWGARRMLGGTVTVPP